MSEKERRRENIEELSSQFLHLLRVNVFGDERPHRPEVMRWNWPFWASQKISDITIVYLDRFCKQEEDNIMFCEFFFEPS